MATTHKPAEALKRSRRVLDEDELKIQHWVRSNYGTLSEIARESGLSVQFVQRIAYNREARSRGYSVERKLLALGCPLIQKIQ